MKKVAETIVRNFLKESYIKIYSAKACIIPKMEASITTHFQQLSLFIFIFIVFVNVKIHVIKLWFC